MITAQKFAANVRGFSKLDTLARAMFAETAAYVLYQFHAHGNKDPQLKLMASDLPGWVRDGFKKLTMGKRDKSMTERIAEMRGDALAGMVFASQEEKRAIAKEQRAARAERKAADAPKVEAPAADPVIVADAEVVEADAKVVEVESALIIGGQVVELTSAEADALYDTLMAMRKQMRLAA